MERVIVRVGVYNNGSACLQHFVRWARRGKGERVKRKTRRRSAHTLPPLFFASLRVSCTLSSWTPLPPPPHTLHSHQHDR